MTDKTIAPTTLGRLLTKYSNLSALGETAESIAAVKVLDLKLLNKQYNQAYTTAEFQALLDSIAPKSRAGKRDADKTTRDKMITETQGLCSHLNLASACSAGLQQMSDAEKCQAYDLLGKASYDLTLTLRTAFSPVGGMTMMYAPAAQDVSLPNGLSVHVAGWEDGSKSLRYQYAPRKVPVAKRSGYRSFGVLFAEIPQIPQAFVAETPVETPAETPAIAKSPEIPKTVKKHRHLDK